MPRALGFLLVSVLAAASASSAGCGGILYTAKINGIETKIEQAKEVGAETLSPYEYYSAKERVTKAKEEASKADYGYSSELLDEADAFADKAIQQATAVKKGAGR